jgi:hypothetical protein
MVKTGFDTAIYLSTGGTCSCTGDQISITGDSCTKIPYLDSHNLNGSRSMIDYTAFGDKIAKQLPGMPALTYDFSGGLDLSDASQLAFWNALSCSAPATRAIRVHEGGKIITVRGYVSGQQLGSTPTGKSTFSASIAANLTPKTC